MGDFWGYVIEALVWSLVGFIGGYLAGRVSHDVHRIATSMEDTVDSSKPHPDGKTLARRARVRARRPTGQFAVGILVVLLAVVTVVQGVITNNTTRRLTDCQSAYANAFADALEARSVASVQAQDALDQLIDTISQSFPNPANQEQRIGAFRQYREKRANAKQQQQQHPYPPPPRECGK